MGTSLDNLEQWEEWSPKIAPHVKGKFEPRTFDPDTGMAEPQSFECVCTYRDKDGKLCGQSWRGKCMSGRVREHVQTFAMQHLHRDPLAAPRIERPGNLRRRGT